MIGRAMEIKTLTQSVIKLDFKPRYAVKPEDLALMAEDVLLCGFGTEKAILRPGDWTELFKELYPKIGLGEYARLLTLVEENFDQEAWKKLTRPNLWTEDAMETLHALSDCSFEFQSWVDDKKVSLMELHPLKLLLQNKVPIKTLQPLLQKVAELSRQEGQQLLEYGVDLRLIKGELPNIGGDAKKTLEYFKDLRFQNTTKQDNRKKSRLQASNLPKNISARWVRMGDQAGLELRILSVNPKDFEKNLNNLKQKKEELCQIIWKDS